LRDFTVDRRVWLLTAVALVIGTGAAGLAVLLLRAIALSTNLFYYHRFSFAMVGPAGSTQAHASLSLSEKNAKQCHIRSTAENCKYPHECW